jgi:nicotinamidase/pyrazinamidase
MDALIIVDVQRDFLPGGTLAVPRGDEIIDVVNRLSRRFATVVATRDWHPPDHISFASQHPGRVIGDIIEVHGGPQILWPDHCVQNTPGAAFAAGLDTSRIARVFDKGTDPQVDSYSAFLDGLRRPASGLCDWLKQAGVARVALVGLALDYCVKQTALDAVALGFETRVMIFGTRGVERRAGDCDAAASVMESAGIRLVDELEEA